MQMSSIPTEENLIFSVFCGCLLATLTCYFLLTTLNLLNHLSIHEATESKRWSVSGRDHLNARNVPGRGENQFLAKAPIENECNYADCVPAIFNTRKSPVVDLKLAKRMIEETFQDILRKLTRSFEERKRDRDGPISLKTMENHAKKIPETDARRKINIEERNNNAQPWTSGESSSRNNETIEEIRGTSSTKFVDQLEQKFGNNEARMKSVFEDRRDERFLFDREENSGNKKVPSSYKFRAHLEIASDDEGPKERLANSGRKIEKRPETSVSRSLAVNFLASILKESSTFWTNSKELLCERMIEADAPADVTRPFEKRVAEMGREEEHDSNMSDKFEEYSSSKGNCEMCGWKKDDYPAAESGVVPEKRANCTEEKSVTRSCNEAVQPRNRETEGREEFGRHPGTNSSKYNRGTESTISLSPSRAASHGKEEEDLNAIIRRMIIAELKRHRKREQTVLKRAHSDTESVVSKRRHNTRNRTGLFSLGGRTFFQDLVELEESLRRNAENTTDSESTVKREDFAKQEGNRSRNDATAADRAHDSINSANLRKIGSNIHLERKVNARCLANVVAERSIVARKASTIHEQSQENKSTQTEHTYVIHSVRSCPLRKRHLPLQLHRQASGREAASSKTVYASLNFSRFVFRKASDNLIYEKSKGSHSPSYIPAPERFRWKYVAPRKTK